MEKRQIAFYQTAFCPNSTSELGYDQACLIMDNVLNDLLVLTVWVDTCYKCSPFLWTKVPPGAPVKLLVPIFYTISFRYNVDDDVYKSCIINYTFGQHGVYKYTMDLSCDYVSIATPPDHPYASFLIFFLLLMMLWVMLMLVCNELVKKRIKSTMKWVNLRRNKSPSEVETEDNETDKEQDFESLSQMETSVKTVFNEETGTEETMELTSRGINTVTSVAEISSAPAAELKQLAFLEFEALLAFRGLTAALWVYLKVERGTYLFLKKSPWNGFRVYDIPIGWFYWALAASFYLHLRFGLIKYGKRWKLWLIGVLLRSVLYFVGGLLFNNINNTSPSQQNDLPLPTFINIRVFGIFQRVALASLITSSVEVLTMKQRVRRLSFFQDLKDCWLQWLMVLIFFIIHISITKALPVPGCPTGYTGAGGLYDNSSASDCTGGAAKYIDYMVIPVENLLPFKALEPDIPIYRLSVPFDPEGLLGTLTTCCLMALGMQASRIFIYFQQPYGRVTRLLFWSGCQLLLGGMLCEFKENEGFIPSNRVLMSASYVLLVSGSAYLALLVLYLLVNIWQFWTGVFFTHLGINMLMVIVGSSLFEHTFPFNWYVRNARTHTEFLIMAYFSVWMWRLACYYMIMKQRIVIPV